VSDRVVRLWDDPVRKRTNTHARIGRRPGVSSGFACRQVAVHRSHKCGLHPLSNLLRRMASYRIRSLAIAALRRNHRDARSLLQITSEARLGQAHDTGSVSGYVTYDWRSIAHDSVFSTRRGTTERNDKTC